VHPYRTELIGRFVTSRAFYLYEQRGSEYFVLQHPIVSHVYGKDGRYRATEHAPDLVLPPGLSVVIDRIEVRSTKTSGPHIALLGKVSPPGHKPVAIYVLLETVGIDLVEWQEQHGVLSSPGVNDYLAKAERRSFSW
jgi:hypothetical protein